MEREKFKLDEIVRNKKELLKIIEEKEIQIEDQKLKLQLANEEIEKIKIELKELKKDISASIIDRVDNQLEEKKSNAFRRINEKDNNISIELVEVEENKQIYGNDPIDEEKFLEESINKIMDEVENYINEIETRIQNVKLNGDRKMRLPGNANFSFKGVSGETLLLKLDEREMCASTGSACSSGSLEPSHVLTAIGLSKEDANNSLRTTFGEINTKEDVKELADSLVEIVEELRKANN